MAQFTSYFIRLLILFINLTMAVHGKIGESVEIKASAERFHEVFSFRPHHISNVSPGNIQSVDLHEGEWGKQGKIINWNYVHDGVAKVAKERVEVIDDENNLTKFRVIEGDLLNDYKDFLITVQATPKGEGSLVTWTFEFEKIHDGVEDPKTLLHFVIDVSKDIDTHLTAVHGKIDESIEIKASAERFHEVFSFRPHHISNVSPGNIQSVDLHEGEWGKQGKIINWNYVHDGVAKVAKERVEVIDDENNLTKFRVIEGDLLNDYKDFLITVQATPKGEGSLVTWTFEFEKIHDGVEDPKTLLHFVIDVSKDIDTHLMEA